MKWMILRIYLSNKKTLNLHFSYIIMYKSCHVRLSSDPHVYYIGKTGYVRPHIQRMSKLTHIGIFRFKLFLLIASLDYLIVSLSLSSTSLIASATVTAAVLIFSSILLFSTGEGRASSPRLKSPRSPKIVVICFMLNLGKSPGLKGQIMLHKNPKHFLETYH